LGPAAFAQYELANDRSHATAGHGAAIDADGAALVNACDRAGSTLKRDLYPDGLIDERRLLAGIGNRARRRTRSTPHYSLPVISGSQVTGKLTELAMKHFACARSCQGAGIGRVGAPGDGHAGAQNHLGEMAAIGAVVTLGEHRHAGIGTQVQVPEHVAACERANQQLLGIVMSSPP